MTVKTVRNLRRISQVFFLILFFFLLFNTEFRGTFSKENVEAVSLPYPVSIYLEFDPLVAFSTAVSAHAIYKSTAWAILLTAFTFLFGRFFCGWICPLGSINHFFGSYKSPKRGARLIKANKYQSWQAVKYYILFGMIAAALFTSLQTGLLDPIPFLVRSLSVSILPGLNSGLRAGLDWMYATDIGFMQAISDGLYKVFGANILSYKQTFFHWGWITGVIFIVVMFLNRFFPRFWCRAVCPLGAFLGIISRYSLLGMEKDNKKCDDCNLCLLHCQGADEPQGNVKWRQSECHLCLNCQTVCPQNVIRFRLFPFMDTIRSEPQVTKRKVLGSLAAGAVFVPLVRSSTGLDKNYNARVIRPPGSLEEREFLKRCIRCGECMKVCPTNALHPTMFEAGLEAMWTPTLIPRVGSCEDSCVLCSQVCPTGAIWQITEQIKKGENGDPRIKIGTASYDRGRCLPWANYRECIVCEEFCPTSPKAVKLKIETVVLEGGKKVELKRPYIDLNQCWGCGVCEKVCPVQDKPAVYVTNIGETRSPTNQILLETSKIKKRMR